MKGAKVLETRAVTYELEITIAAPPARVWQALTEETNAWWLPDYHEMGEGSVVSFDATAGGQLIERKEGGPSFLWSTVLMCHPGESIHLVGYAASEWGGPATTMMKFALEETDGGTTLKVTDALFGHVLDSHVDSLQGGWRQLFTEGLKAYVESRTG